MTQTALHPTPRTRDVLRAQIRATGSALRGPALIAAALVALVTLFVAIDLWRTGGVITFHPEHQMLPGMLGLLFPLVVWKGVERFGAAFLWTLPVDRCRHALARVFAGWVWLMGLVSFFVAWLMLFCLVSGGSLLEQETLRLLPSPGSLSLGGLDPGTLATVRWTPHPLLWLVPFTAATGTYLLASALALGVRHPLRWIAGTVLGVLLVVGAGHASRADWLVDAPQDVLARLFEGRYGFDALLTARTESLKIEDALPTGETVVVWRELPTLGQWAIATLLWTAGGLAALWGAVRRHGEGRKR
jgi:hypothetical protein